MKHPRTPQEILKLKDLVVKHFLKENWHEIGFLLEVSHIVTNHDRLLRSLSWGDADYAGNVLEVMQSIFGYRPESYDELWEYLETRFPNSDVDEVSLTDVKRQKRFTFSPEVFQITSEDRQDNLVALLMPFEAAFSAVHTAIVKACGQAFLECKRVDDIWEDSTIIQDIFNLICRSKFVVADLSGKNPNVFYEVGIAHTLGRKVIPLAQHESDVPFDLRHHRYLQYLPNDEGLAKLTERLAERLNSLRMLSI